MHLARKTKHSILLNCPEVSKTTTKEYVTKNLEKLESVHSAFELKQDSLFQSNKCKIKKTN